MMDRESEGIVILTNSVLIVKGFYIIEAILRFFKLDNTCTTAFGWSVDLTCDCGLGTLQEYATH